MTLRPPRRLCESLYTALKSHPLYENIKTIEDLRIFTKVHCFAVWDFMSLIKAIQGVVTCTTVPWTPLGDYNIARLVNDIILGEETDIDANNVPSSHYDMYLAGMRGIRADHSVVSKLFIPVNILRFQKSPTFFT